SGGHPNLSGVEVWKHAAAANQAPTVSLAAASNSVTVNTALALTATAADADGSVSKVEFFSGATKLGEDTSAPYTLSFSPAAAGPLSLTARATDNAGATTTSAAISVTVTA
ncbi:Ig-like domain-containing protein, partial [Hymenobacter rubripertinctus]